MQLEELKKKHVQVSGLLRSSKSMVLLSGGL